MKRVFKVRWFVRWARKAGLTDAALWEAVWEMERGLIDADLGGGVVKKRVAMQGRGKSGGARTLIITNHGDRWFFVAGFAKNATANISPSELEALKLQAPHLLNRSNTELDTLVRSGDLTEIGNHGDEK